MRLRRRDIARILLCAIAVVLSACKQATESDVESSLFRVLTVKQLSYGSIIGTGTAFKISGSSTVVTNNHVVKDAATIVLVYWSEGRFVETEARLEYADDTTDLALLKAVRPLPGRPLPIAHYSPSSGSEAWAFGFPAAADAVFGRVRSIDDFLEKLSADASMSQPTRTSGTISGERPRNRTAFIQHQVPISPGNSGGPLIDACGSVIGINTLAALGTGSIFGSVSSRELIELLHLRSLDAIVVGSRCWVVFEPRYMTYSVSAIAAVVVLVVGLFVFVRLTRREPRWTGWQKPRSALRGGARTSSGRVIDITPIPLEIAKERPQQPSNRVHGSAAAQALRSARLIPVDGGPPIEIPIDQVPGSVMIGRGADCGVVLDNKTVSKRHCRLDFEATGEIKLHDVGSGNGTRLNGIQLAEGTIRTGDKIGFGTLEFRLVLNSRPADARVGSPGRNGVTSWLLIATDEKGKARKFLIDVAPQGTWVLGRNDEDADLVIPSPTVSAKHAVLRFGIDGGLENSRLGFFERNHCEWEANRTRMDRYYAIQ